MEIKDDNPAKHDVFLQTYKHTCGECGIHYTKPEELLEHIGSTQHTVAGIKSVKERKQWNTDNPKLNVRFNKDTKELD